MVILPCKLTDNKNHTFHIFAIISLIWYYIFTLAYPITAYIYFKTLKCFFPAKAKSMKKRLFISMILISIPIFIRGTYFLILVCGVNISYQDDSIKK
jgi:hypothetical protein